MSICLCVDIFMRFVISLWARCFFLFFFSQKTTNENIDSRTYKVSRSTIFHYTSMNIACVPHEVASQKWPKNNYSETSASESHSLWEPPLISKPTNTRNGPFNTRNLSTWIEPSNSPNFTKQIYRTHTLFLYFYISIAWAAEKNYSLLWKP